MAALYLPHHRFGPGRRQGERLRGRVRRPSRLHHVVTLAHISDPHVGSPFFVPNLMNRVIVELNDMEPDAVILTGDLTAEGYRQGDKNCLGYLSRINAPLYVIP